MKVICLTDKWGECPGFLKSYNVINTTGSRHPTNKSDKNIYYYHYLAEIPGIGFRVENFAQIGSDIIEATEKQSIIETK